MLKKKYISVYTEDVKILHQLFTHPYVSRKHWNVCLSKGTNYDLIFPSKKLWCVKISLFKYVSWMFSRTHHKWIIKFKSNLTLNLRLLNFCLQFRYMLYYIMFYWVSGLIKFTINGEDDLIILDWLLLWRKYVKEANYTFLWAYCIVNVIISKRR